MSFLDSFFRVEVEYDEINRMYTVSGPLRLGPAYSKYNNFSKNAFTVAESSKCVFHEVFLPEVIAWFSWLLNHNSVNANVTLLGKAITELFALEKKQVETSTKYDLDLNIAKAVMDKDLLPYWIPVHTGYGEYKRRTHNRGLLLFASAGLSKTSNSLAIAEMLHAKKILVISPNNAVYKVWVKSIIGYSGEKSEYKHPEKNKVWTISDMGSYKDERFVIVNYEALDKLLPMINKIAGKDTVVIIDESHNFADQKSKRTNLLIDILDKSMSQNVLLLSGTPIKSYSTEIINIARMVNTDIRGDIFVRLSNIYRNTPNYLKDILVNRFQNLSVTIEKKEANLDPVIKTYVPVTLKNGDDYTLDKIRNDMKVYINDRISFIEKHRDSYNKAYAIYIEQILKAGWEKKSKYTYKEYRKLFDEIQMAANRNMLRLYTTQIALCNRIEKEMAQFLPPISRDDWHETKTILKYPMLKIQGECLGKIVMGARVKCHMDIAKELDYLDILSNTVKKTIIFSNYIEVCEQAKQAVSMLKLNPVTVYGENTKNLTKEVDVFSKDKKRNPLITTYKSLSTAVPLTVANVVIAMDLPFRMYIFEQAISRVWRNGQDTQVLVYIPTLDTGSKDNINQRNFDIISFFNQAVEEMTGFKSSLDIDETVKSIAAQPFINLENLSVATDILYSDFNYTAYLDTSITHRMIKWR